MQAKRALIQETTKQLKDDATAAERAAAIGGAAQGGQGIESAIEIRDAVQCWLLYNTVPLAKYAEQLYSQQGPGAGGIGERPGFFSNNLQPSSDKKRMSFVDKSVEGIALTGLLNYRKGTKDFINIQ